jgi:rubrerythrin
MPRSRTPWSRPLNSEYYFPCLALAPIYSSQRVFFFNRAIAEASYRATIHSYGKKQTTLSPGWETLGLDKETADRIFQEEAKEGFLSQREVMYGQQSQRYNKKGQVVDREGKLVDPSLADEEEEEDDSPAGSSVSNAFECSQCGFTLFVAQGRESKFFGTGFTCPECGAPKSKFEAKEDFGE